MSHRIIRLKVRLIDEINLFDEGRARKIIYGLDSRKNLSVRDIRQDLTRKLGLNNQLCDVEIWIGDYLVPGWTSSLVFKEDDDVQIKIVEAGKTVNDDGDYLESENGQAELESLQAALAAEDVIEAKQDGSCPAVGSPTVPTAAGHFVRPKFQPSFGPYGMGMSAPKPLGQFTKPAMQCFHWDNPAHVRTSCKFWHPRDKCKNFPHCTAGAASCGYAHPFCGEFCVCPPRVRDVQYNHRIIPKPTVPGGNGVTTEEQQPMQTAQVKTDMSLA